MVCCLRRFIPRAERISLHFGPSWCKRKGYKGLAYGLPLEALTPT